MIGTPTSRIDGHAKVTGAAKYAGEFNTDGLAYGAVVASTIAKGRIVRIDASDALRVEGVLDVLTHENRPPMARANAAYKDDVAPEDGSPFRPLYDDKIKFSGQPIAAGARRGVGNRALRRLAPAHRIQRSGLRHRPAGAARQGLRRRRSRRSRAAMPTEPMRQPRCATRRNTSSRPSITIRWNCTRRRRCGTATASSRSTTRPRACRTCSAISAAIFDLKPDDLRVISPFVGGAFGSGLRPQYQAVLAVLAARALQRSVRLVLTRQQMYGLGYRPATIERLALGATAGGTLRCDHPRGDRGHLAIRRFFPQRHRMVGSALQKRQREICAPPGAARSADALRHAGARRGHRRPWARMRDGRTRRCAQARSA